QPPRWRRTCAAPSRPAPISRRQRQSANGSPSAHRRRASRRSCSIAAVTSTTAASRRLRTRRARAGSVSKDERRQTRTSWNKIMAREPRDRREREERDSEFTDKLVHINRVAKVVKGGRPFGFAALVVVGDEKGGAGLGPGRARGGREGSRRAGDGGKRGLIRVPVREGRTVHHDGAGRHGAGRVFLRAAPPGTGIIAGGPMRAVFETLGMQDVVAKSLGSSNPYNMVR